ncbi:hypothetical protein ACFQT0_06875 [Hymenobacter humi]|uniref:Tetratricopeptide repeat protein n=1 Tax=Hymenobacter humi TaxID=1411620 RepID=A0ABW2U416_9BACT
MRTLDDTPYRRLRAGLVLWHRDTANAAALDSMKAAVAAFDRVERPIPWLLIDLVTLYNRQNAMEARRQYYDEKLAFYRLRGNIENIAACYLSRGRFTGGWATTTGPSTTACARPTLPSSSAGSCSSTSLLVTGAIYADWGNTEKAVEYLSQAQALPEFRQVQGQNRVFTFLALSKLYLQQHHYPAALQSADSALAARVPDAAERGMTQAHGMVQKAAVLLQMQQTEPAGRLLARAQQLTDSLRLPMADKPGELEIDATWARYYTAQRDYTRAEKHWRLAYEKATAAKLNRLRPRYLQQLSAFYDAQGKPAEAQRYSRAFIALADSFNAAQNTFHIAQYESERVEQAQNEQISDLRQAQAVQAVRLRLGNWLLFGALLAVVLVSALGAFIYRQLRINRRTLQQPAPDAVAGWCRPRRWPSWASSRRALPTSCKTRSTS